MEAILGLKKGEVMLNVRMLRSLIHIPLDAENGNSDLAIMHASFSGFITDQRRAGEFFVDIKEIHAEIVLGSLRLIQENLDDDELDSAE